MAGRVERPVQQVVGDIAPFLPRRRGVCDSSGCRDVGASGYQRGDGSLPLVEVYAGVGHASLAAIRLVALRVGQRRAGLSAVVVPRLVGLVDDLELLQVVLIENIPGTIFLR